MSTKFNCYAKRLNEAFLKARTEHEAARAEFDQAALQLETRLKEIKNSPVARVGERDRAIFDAETACRDAQHAARMRSGRAWWTFDSARDAIARELRECLEREELANPDDVDQGTMRLVDSGILAARDFVSLLDRFSDNRTMIRLLGASARKLLSPDNPSDQISEEDRRALSSALSRCKTGPTLQAWEALCNTASVCSGSEDQRNLRFVSDIASRWEELTADAVESF